MHVQRRKLTFSLLAGMASMRTSAQPAKPEPAAPPAGGRADIVPLVRAFSGPIRKVQDIKPVTGAKVQGEADLAPLIDTFVGDLDIRYAFDAENGFRYLNERDLKTLNIARDQLLRLAMTNFKRRYPKISVERPVAFVGKIVNAGDLEPSMMLDADFWEKEKARPMYAGGEVVAAAPVRDVLWFTSLMPAENVRNLRDNTERSHNAAGERAVSKLMYVWRKLRWEVLDA
jgi:uncharacterized protein YtpQ (UPF0354 family)